MKAVVIRSYGSAEALEIGEKEVPSPAADECVVKVLAAGVNPIDWKIRKGMLRLIKRIPLTDVRAAHEESEAGHVAGKLVLEIG